MRFTKLRKDILQLNISSGAGLLSNIEAHTSHSLSIINHHALNLGKIVYPDFAFDHTIFILHKKKWSEKYWYNYINITYNWQLSKKKWCANENVAISLHLVDSYVIFGFSMIFWNYNRPTENTIISDRKIHDIQILTASRSHFESHSLNINPYWRRNEWWNIVHRFSGNVPFSCWIFKLWIEDRFKVVTWCC